MAARVLAQLGAGTAAEAGAQPACFDAAVAGDSLWVAARCDERSVVVVHAPAEPAGGRAASNGSLLARVSLPEPLALVQLGAAHLAAEEEGPAVLLLVGASCRVWALQLHPPARSSRAAQPGPTAKVEAAAIDAVEVSLAQPACPARHQLAAAVAWEHLAFSWDPAPGSQQTGSMGRGDWGPSGPRGGAGGSHGEGGVVPLPLDKLAAALQRYRGHGQMQDDQVPPLLVHSVASWVCHMPGPAAGGSAAATPAIPADATAAAYVGRAAADSGSAERVACRARFELPAAACTEAMASPAGYLLVATARGQVLALPVGTTMSPGRQQGMQQHAADAGAALLPIAVCVDSSGSSSSSSMCILPLQVPNEGSGSTAEQPPQELVLLAEAGQLIPAAPAGLGSCQATTIVAGGGSCSGTGASPAAPASMVAAGACTATVLLAGVQAVAAMGSTLCYLLCQRDASSSSSSKGSMLRCLDLAAGGSPLQAFASDVVLAGASTRTAGQPLLLVAASAAAEQQQRQQLVMLTSQGTLLAVAGAVLSTGRHAGEAQQALAVPSLEASIQVSASQPASRIAAVLAGAWIQGYRSPACTDV